MMQIVFGAGIENQGSFLVRHGDRKWIGDGKDMQKVVVFSSAEQRDFVRALEEKLVSDPGLCVEAWFESLFRSGRYTLGELLRIGREYDYAVIVLTPDDVVVRRESLFEAPRDNVVFELGYAITAFGVPNVIVLALDDVVLPTDMQGVTVVRECTTAGIDIAASRAAVKACAQIRSNATPGMASQPIRWESYFRDLCELIERIDRSEALGGFPADLVIGIPGNFSPAVIVSDGIRAELPVAYLNPHRRNGKSYFSRDDQQSGWCDNAYLVDKIVASSVEAILVVDNISRRAHTVLAAKEYLEEELRKRTSKRIVIKTAVVYMTDEQRCAENAKRVDYVGRVLDVRGRRLEVTGGF